MRRAVRWLACLAIALGATARAQSVDATHIGTPINLSSETWRFTPGDDLRYADPAFDDSQWKTFLPQKGFKTQGLTKPRGTWWLRIHVRLAPGTRNLAATVLQGSYQIYINGKLIGQRSGFPDHPYATNVVEQVYAVPADAAPGDSMVVAIRAGPELDTEVNDPPYFYAGSMFVGDATLLRDRRNLYNDSRFFKYYAEQIVEGILAFILAISALGLFRAQPDHREYLWLAVTALSDAAFNFAELPATLSQVPLWEARLPRSIFTTLLSVAFVLFVCAFLRVRVNGWIRAYCAALLLLPILDLGFAQGWILWKYDLLAGIVLSSPTDVFAPLLAIRQLRRGDREAGILLLPLLLLGAADYDANLDLALNLVFRNHVSIVPNAHLGPVYFAPYTISSILFYFTIGAIMLRRSMQITREQQRTAAELEEGRSVQAFLLDRDASAPGFTVESAYLPAQEVGGDFFQTIAGTDGSLLAVIGDVAGKGLQAAMRVSMLIGAVRLSPNEQPAALLGKLNKVLLQDGSSGFTTCLAARLSLDGTATIANAGHPAPYLNGHELPIEGGLPLGVALEADYSEQTFAFGPGDTVLLLSDGVIEATSPSGELFGFSRMAETAAHVTAANSLAETARVFGHQDDITVLLIHRATPAEVSVTSFAPD